MDLKRADTSVREKFRAQLSVKKVILTFFKDMKGSIIIDFLLKTTNVNIVSYCTNLLG